MKLETELAMAIDAMWEKLKETMSEDEQDAFTKIHPIISEIDEFGIEGPIGSGLRKFGGHAIG